MTGEFAYGLAPFIAFRVLAACERVRGIPRSAIAEHGNPEFRIAVVDEASDFYTAFAYFKFAVICEGIHYRHTHRLTVGDGFDGIGAMVPELVRRGLVALHQ